MEADERSVYAARRARLMEAIGDGGVAILSSGHEVVRSRDTEYVFRASSDVLYLAGFDEPEAKTSSTSDHVSSALPRPTGTCLLCKTRTFLVTLACL